MNKILTFLAVLAASHQAFSQHADIQTAQLLCNQNGLTIESLEGGSVSSTEVAKII